LFAKCPFLGFFGISARDGGFFKIPKNPFNCFDSDDRSKLVSNMDEIGQKMCPPALYTESDFTPMKQNEKIMCTIFSDWVKGNLRI